MTGKHSKDLRRKGVFLVLLAAGTLAVWWLWPRADGENGNVENRLVAPLEKSALPQINAAARKPAPEPGTPEYNQFILERCAKWMESRGRDAASLVALWDLAGDESLLLEAAEKFPDDPRVCVAMIGHLAKSGGDALPWAERLIAVEPENAAAHYWKATLLANAHKPEESLKALRAATELGGKPDAHLRDRIVTAREALLASGGSVKEAAAAALDGPLSKNMPMISGRIASALREAIIEAKNSGNEDRMAEAAGLGVAAAEHLRYAVAPPLIDELIANSFLRAYLKELPPDAEYGNDGKTAGGRLEEIENEKAEIQKLMKSGNHSDAALSNLSEAQASEFADRVILHGEWAARRWLNDLHINGVVTRVAEAPPR